MLRHFFQASPKSWIQFHTFELKSSDCVLIEVHRQPQLTCQAGTVANNSFTSILAFSPQRHHTLHRGLSSLCRVTEIILVKVDVSLPLDSAGV